MGSGTEKQLVTNQWIEFAQMTKLKYICNMMVPYFVIS